MHRFQPTALAALVAVLALALAACSPGSGSPEAAGSAPASHASHVASSAASESEPAEAEPSETTAESEEASADDVRVRLESSNFDPSELSISAGTTVLFLNADSYAHTVSEGTGGQAADDPIVDREVAENRTVRVTFEEPGTYEITCRLHPSMQMTITVEG